jgi:cobalt-zinc-cadmium efflux system protein
MHAHGHAPDHDHRESLPARPLLIALLLTLSFAGVEAVAGWWAGSLALMGDAGHMLSDSFALGLAALAAIAARRPASDTHSYGYGRTEVIAAITNAVIMLGIVIGIVIAAIGRLQDPPEVHAGGVILVASIGLVINLVVYFVLSRGAPSMNIRGAMLHVLGDLLGSVAALASGVTIALTGLTIVDPLLSLFISLLLLIAAARLIRDAIGVLMDAVPAHVDLPEVAAALKDMDGVVAIHDLHIWTIASGRVAISAHVVVDDIGKWPDRLTELQDMLSSRYEITHVTLQPEAAETS